MSSSSVLWALNPPQGEQSWLLGTMHIRDNRVFQHCKDLYPLILKADVYAGEMDLDQSMTSAPVGPSYSMKSFFRPTVYAKLRKQLLKSFHLDVAPFDHLHPMMIMSAFTQKFLQQDHAVSMDEHLWNFAKSNQLTVQGIESLEEQINLLHQIDPGALYQQIKKVSSRPGKFRRFTDRTLDHYINGRIHPLYKETKTSMHHLRKTLIYDRNKIMAERIMAFPPQQSFFIALGAGHLSGNSGIISRLRKAGYKVKAVDLSPTLETSSMV